MNHLLFVDDMVVLASSKKGLQHELDQLSGACHQLIMKISTKKYLSIAIPETQVSICCKYGKRQFIAGQESSITLVWYSWMMEGRATRLIHELVMRTQFLTSYIALWSQNGSFHAFQSCHFSNWSLYRSLSHESWVMTKGDIWSTSGRDGIFAEFTVWHFAAKCTAVKSKKA